MKKIFFYIIAVLFIGLAGCEKYIDIVPDDRPQIKDAFRNEATVETYVFTCYSFIPRYNNARGNFSWLMSNETVASYHWGTQFFQFLPVQQGLISAASPTLNIWEQCYKGIRQCYLYLDNIDKAVATTITPEEFAQRKKVWTAEVKFLIAYYHYVLLQNYGPIVLIDKFIPTNAPTTEMNKPRKPYDECVTFIAGRFDEAMTDLPVSVANAEFGRATKSIAQALKARMYLFAASPLFNGNSEFYSNFKGPDGVLLIAQTADKEKWKKAMDETKKAIDMAEANGNRLYNYTKTTIADPFEQAVMTARWQMVDPWNSELIWGYSSGRETAGAQESFQTLVTPRGWRTGTPNGGIGATLSAVETFYSAKGIPAETDPDYGWANRFAINPGDSTIRLNRNREPRFYGYVGFDRGKYEISNETRILKLRAGETNGTTLTNGNANLSVDHLYSGYAIKKGIHPGTTVSSTAFTVTPYPWPIIRLAELYLSYAEAAAAYTGTLDATALGYINAVRKRAGIPNLEVAYGGLPAGDALTAAIQRERLIEFMFEGHSLYDLKRWKRAEAYYAPDKNGMRGLFSLGKTAGEFYKDTKLARTYVFERKHYLYPILVDYVRINPNLVNNPGW